MADSIPAEERVYPTRPVTGVVAVVRRGDRFLLVRRGREPGRGRWGFPGGAQELGETLFVAAARELLEETGVDAEPGVVIDALDVLDRDETGRVRHHYTLIAIALHWRSGEGIPDDDVDALGWYAAEDLAALPALPSVAMLMRKALAALPGETGLPEATIRVEEPGGKDGKSADLPKGTL